MYEKDYRRACNGISRVVDYGGGQTDNSVSGKRGAW